MTLSVPKITGILGGVAFIATSVFHGINLPLATAAATTAEHSFMQNALEALWLFPSVHWLLFGVAVIWAVWRPNSATRFILILATLAGLADATLIYSHVGVFIGGIFLTIAGALSAIAALTMKPDANR